MNFQWCNGAMVEGTMVEGTCIVPFGGSYSEPKGNSS